MKEYKVIQGQSLYDVCILLYGNLGAIHQLISDNDFIDGFSYVFLGGEIVRYRPNLFNILPSSVTTNKKVDTGERMVKGQDRQSFYDICITTYCRLDDLLKLLVNSGIDSMNDVRANGLKFTYNENEIIDKQMYEKMRKISSGLLGFSGGSGGTVVPSRAFSSGFQSGFL